MDGQPFRAPAARRLSLVIPAYNEEAGIRQAVAEADEALARLAADYEVLVVDDGSGDGTAAVVEEEERARPHVRLLRHPTNRGYGAALRTGFEAARFDRVAFTDADCQFHLDDLGPLLRLSDRVPVAVGYRLGRQDTPKRRFFSFGYNVLARALLGTRVRDCDCALKVFRKDALANLLPETNGFFVNTEMLTRARQLRYRVAEVGVRHRPRLRGFSKVSLGDVPRTLRTLLPFWWSHLMFPGASPLVPARGEGGPGGVRARLDCLHFSRTPSATQNWPPRGNEATKPRPLTRNPAPPSAAGRGEATATPWFFLTLLVVAVLLFFSRLNTPLLEPQEARYAEIPRQMLAEGSWLVPVLHGEPYLDKPPLFYWLVMGSYAVFGVQDWAARLVPAAAGLLTVLLTFFWGRSTVGPRAAFVGALVLCLSARFVYMGRLLTMDGLLCLWVTAALAAAHMAASRPASFRRWWLVSALACGLGLLTKGPVALALVAVPVLAFQVIDPRAARPTRRAWAAYLAVALAVAAPWFVAVAVRQPDFLRYFFWVHHVRRFVVPFDHEEPFWYYLPGLLLGTLPWSLLLPGLVRFLARRSPRAAARRPAALGFFLLAFGWCLLFFSAAGCKRSTYILPAFPPLALALGYYLHVLVPEGAVRGALAAGRRPAAALARSATLLVLGCAAGGSLLAGYVGLVGTTTAILLAAAAALGFAAVFSHGHRRAPAAWALCGATTFVVLLTAVHQLLPGYARRFSVRGHVRSVAEDPSLAQLPAACYPRRWDGVSFYLRRQDVRAYTEGQLGQLLDDLRRDDETLLFVQTRALEGLLGELPAGLEFVPEGRQGRVSAGRVRARRVVPPGLYAGR